MDTSLRSLTTCVEVRENKERKRRDSPSQPKKGREKVKTKEHQE